MLGSPLRPLLLLRIQMVCLRLARLQDLPEVADLAARAMVDDELFAYLCPRRHQYYADFRQAFLRRFKSRLATPGFVVIVAVDRAPQGHSSSGGEQIEQIRGYGVWERLGKAVDAVRWQQQQNGWWHALERALLNLENRYLALASPDRSVDLHRLEHYTLVSAEDCFPFDNYPELWFLNSLAVDPTYQRRGIGRQLVEWGLQQARREQVPVGLEASLKGVGLYQRLGFRRVNRMELLPEITVDAMLWQDTDDQANPA